jgi:hypothetical protein
MARKRNLIIKVYVFIFILLFHHMNSVYAQTGTESILLPNAFEPHMAIDGQDRLHLIAISKPHSGVLYAQYDLSGTEIVGPTFISDFIGDDLPRLALNDEAVVVVWRRSLSFGGDYIMGQQLTIDGQTVGDSIRFSEDCCPVLVWPDVTFLDDSTYVVVWSGEGTLTPDSGGIYGQLATTSGRFIDSNLQFSDHVGPGVNHNAVRVLSGFVKDNFLVVWQDDFQGNYKTFGRLFSFDGIPLTSSFLVSEDTTMTVSLWLDVATDPTGGFGITWYALKDSLWQVRYRNFEADGAPQGISQKVNSNRGVGGADPSPEIAFDENGNSIIVWLQREGNVFQLMAQRFLADGAFFGPNYSVSIHRPAFAQGTASGVLRDGEILTAWSEWDTTKNNVQPNPNIWFNMRNFNDLTVNVDGGNLSAPDGFRLFQNYPNPFNPATTINFEIAKRSQVQLVIYNTLGEKIQTLLNEELLPGSYAVLWDGKNERGGDEASGLYFVEWRASGLQRVGKMLLIR